ncbi:ABC transporter ATP-binding protein [Candidatus Bathyarchaeota archaeon]|nr:ABC transporter ATP-binding protein [Candidatus Bathyarchaeota archaeon]
MEAVKTENLVKVYHGKETVEALRGVSLSVKKGELFTLLGPNGAGKTTFLRIISTQLLPTSGEAYVLGFNVLDEAEKVREHIAVVPQDVATYGNFTPWEYCYYFSLLRGMAKQKVKEVSERALKAVELWELRNRTCATLSGGERKRAIIAAALASDAEVLMLDEPTSGLDAVARRKVWSVLREMVEQGKTILLTTHIMEEAEMVSDRLAIINKGQLVAQGTVEEIKSLAEEKFRVVVEGSPNLLEKFANNYSSVSFGSKRVIYVNSGDEAIELVRKALKSGLKAEAAPITLEDVFVKLVGGVELNEH